MSNVNFYPQNTVVKPDHPVNSIYIQKILDENVALIHTIMEKQQLHHTQESDELLKNLHKNLIYLATIADQTTSAGNQGPNINSSNQYNYNGQVPQAALPNPSYHTNIPIQQQNQVQPSYIMSGNEVVDKKSQVAEEDPTKDVVNKGDYSTSYGVDMDKECDKMPPIKEVVNQSPMPIKSADIDRSECTQNVQTEMSKEVPTPKTINTPETGMKSEEIMYNQNSNIKTDMPPPSQLPLGVHPTEKSPAHYPANQRFGYPAVNPNFQQYNPHYDQSKQFYPQSPFQQQSPYNYQGMYSPYQQVPPPSMSGGHYNQHMMATGPVYPQYPYYQQPMPGTMDHMSQPPGKDPSQMQVNAAMHGAMAPAPMKQALPDPSPPTSGTQPMSE